VGWSGCMFQYNEQGYPCLICVFAFCWQDAQRGRDTKCKEAYAIVATMRLIAKLRLPCYVTIRTDHHNLLKMRVSDDPTLRRWYFELMAYFPLIQHVPGAVNVMDHPSRICTTVEPGAVPADQLQPSIAPPVQQLRSARVFTRRAALTADAPASVPTTVLASVQVPAAATSNVHATTVPAPASVPTTVLASVQVPAAASPPSFHASVADPVPVATAGSFAYTAAPAAAASAESAPPLPPRPSPRY